MEAVRHRRTVITLLLSQLFCVPVMAASKGEPATDGEVIRMLEFLREMEMIKQVDLLKELNQVPVNGDAERVARPHTSVPTEKKADKK